MPEALEVRRLVEAEAPRRGAEFLGREQRLDLVAAPDVEPAFVSFGVGIDARVEPAFRRAHLAQHPVRRVTRRPQEQRFAGGERRPRKHRQQLPVVVQHLLEMRNAPRGVDRITRKAAAQLVVDAALGHAGQGERGHVQRLQVGVGVARTRAPVAQAALDAWRLRELGGGPETAEAGIEIPFEQLPGGEQRGGAECGLAGRFAGGQALEGQGELGVLPLNVGCMSLEIPGHPAQHLGEPRHSLARLLRKVGSPEEGPAIRRREEQGQRPAPRALGDELLGGLIDPVEVRTFLAVDLDVDEQLVHQGRDPRIFEGFVRHDVAPVTGGIAHRQQHGLVRLRGGRERLLAPRVPIDGILRMLEQIRTGFGGEAIAVQLDDPCRLECAPL